ncbi:hypothetical protein NDU88_001365 [Pleurodeles waltl]|uniref:Uncharacterized protein n=1 Tax=Pleurodeles waltl TaxID=8319 RepID=A0AAV7MSJ3_PLEWA|nr:hypothetical protein NDU88_001365 [Pleurodeles waltl]
MEVAEEDENNGREAEQKGDTMTEQQGSSGDPNKDKHVEESDGKEEETTETRGEDTMQEDHATTQGAGIFHQKCTYWG